MHNTLLPLAPRPAQRILQLPPLLLPSLGLGLCALIEPCALGVDGAGTGVVLLPGIVERGLGLRERGVAPGTRFRARGFFLAALGFALLLCSLESLCGLAFGGLI